MDKKTKIALYIANASCIIWIFVDVLSCYVYFTTKNPIFITWALLSLILMNMEVFLIREYKKEDKNGDKI